LIVSQEVFEREVLFEFFEKKLDLPPVLVDSYYLGFSQFQIVGQENEQFLVVLIPISNFKIVF
jgi:hypothetical protein